MRTQVTKRDILIVYDAANWFFKNRPDNPARRGEEYSGHALAIPFYTMPFDFKNLKTFEETEYSVNGFTAMVDDTFVIAFDSSDDAQDWKTNFGWKQMIMPYAESKNSAVRMHGDYARGWMNIRQEIMARFRDSKAKKVLVGGYSMGGGMSPIAALDFQYNFNLKPEDVHCVIGDGPRVFNEAGRDSYNSRVPNTVRVKWGNDAVTKVPMTFLGFRHVGQMLHFGPKERWWKISYLNHDPGLGEYNSIMYQLEDGEIPGDRLIYKD